jgi:hypothetical protein
MEGIEKPGTAKKRISTFSLRLPEVVSELASEEVYSNLIAIFQPR